MKRTTVAPTAIQGVKFTAREHAREPLLMAVQFEFHFQITNP